MTFAAMEKEKKVLTMAEYIEREAILREIERREALMVGDKLVSVDAMKSFIKNRPAADVAPVRHGRWYMLDDCANAGLYCSACGRRVHHEEFAYKKLRSKYCPHCGARMDGGADHA